MSTAIPGVRTVPRIGCPERGPPDNGRPQAQHRATVALVRTGDRNSALPMLRTALSTAQGLRADYLCGPIAGTLAELGERAVRRRSSTTPGALSGREAEVMRLVAMGRTSRQIGTELFLSPRTVEMHVQDSMTKLDCRTRAEAVRRLAELGLTAAGGTVRP